MKFELGYSLHMDTVLWLSKLQGCMEDVLRRNELGAVPSEVFLRIHNNNNNNNNNNDRQ